MKLYASSTLMWGKGIREMAQLAHEFHLDGIELWAEQAWFCHMNTREIVQVLKQYGLGVTVHAASWDTNICSLNERIRRKSLEEIFRSIIFADAIQAKNVTVHPGKRTSSAEWTLWHEKILNQSLDQLEEIANHYGITLSVELMEEADKELITTAASLNRFITHRSEAIQTTFHLAHISLDNVLNELQRVNKMYFCYSTLEQPHAPLGDGKIKQKQFLERIMNKDYITVLDGFDTSENAWTLQKHLSYLETCRQAMEEIKFEVFSNQR